MTAGELDRRAIFLRRMKVDPDKSVGESRGAFRPVFSVRAGYSPLSAQRRADYGYAEDVLAGWLKVRESRDIASLTIADRVRFNADADEFAIDSVPLADRSGYRLLRISRKMG